MSAQIAKASVPEAGPIRSGFANRAGMRMSMTQAHKVVAQETLSALGRRGTVRPGLLAKTLEASLTFLPRLGRVRIMAMLMGGMTKHHDGKVPGQNQQSA